MKSPEEQAYEDALFAPPASGAELESKYRLGNGLLCLYKNHSVKSQEFLNTPVERSMAGEFLKYVILD